MYLQKDLNKHYRPNTWEAVKGQSDTVKILRSQVITGNGLSNAYLFFGNSGTGKTTLAKLFFRALNCLNPTKTGNPCFNCESCLNPKTDFHEVNASNTRGIEDMRNLIQIINYVPKGKYKCVLLDEVHMLLEPAYNCLLKPLESASKQAIWLLATTNLDRIPVTIKTRCQIFELRPLNPEHIFSRLKEITIHSKINASNEDLWKISKHSDNNLRQAIHSLEQYISGGDLKKILPKKTSKNQSYVVNETKLCLIEALKALSLKVKHGKLRLSVIKEAFNELNPDFEQQTEQSIGYELKEMGLERRKVGGRTHLVWDSEKINKLFGS